MSSATNPVEAELFRHHWDDGLLDVFAGVGVIGIGAAWSLGHPVLGPMVPAVLLPIWGPLRRRVVEPRAGFVEFSAARGRRSRRGLRHTLLLGVVVLALTVLAILLARDTGGGDARERLAPAVPAALLAVLAWVASSLTGARRFVLYGAVLLASGGAAALGRTDPALPMLAGGLVVLAAGVGRLRCFVREADRWKREEG